MRTIQLALAAAALCMSVTAFSQTDTATQKRDTTARRTDTTSAQLQNQVSGTVSDQTLSSGTSTVSSSPKPNFGRYYIPVLGTYQASQTAEGTSSQSAAQSVTVIPDETNAGKVWVEGLTPVKFYALLKSAPATYKIPAQKQDKTSLQEGTITYDESSKQISICLGCGFNEKATATENTPTDTEATPTSAKSKKTAKTKSTVISFSGTKTDQTTAGIQ